MLSFSRHLSMVNAKCITILLLCPFLLAMYTYISASVDEVTLLPTEHCASLQNRLTSTLVSRSTPTTLATNGLPRTIYKCLAEPVS